MFRGFVNVNVYSTVEEALEVASASIVREEPCFVSVYGPNGRIFSYELPMREYYA